MTSPKWKRRATKDSHAASKSKHVTNLQPGQRASCSPGKGVAWLNIFTAKICKVVNFISTDAADSTRLSPEELAKLSKDTGGVTMRQWDWQVIALNDLQWIYLCNLCNHAVICRPISSNPWLRSREFTTRWSGGAKGLPRSPSCCPASACGQEAADQGGDSFHGSLVPPSLLALAKNAVSLFTRLKEGKNKRHSERLVGRRGTQCGTWDSTRNGWYIYIIYIYNIYIYYRLMHWWTNAFGGAMRRCCFDSLDIFVLCEAKEEKTKKVGNDEELLAELKLQGLNEDQALLGKPHIDS